MQNSFSNNSSNKNPSSAAHYNQKQKGSQIIRLDTKEAQVSMNLAGLIPNFSNLVATQNTSSDIYYQLRSFRCINPPQDLIHKAVFKLTIVAQADSLKYLCGILPALSQQINVDISEQPLYFSISDIADYSAPIFHSPQQLIYQMEKSILYQIPRKPTTYRDKVVASVFNLATFIYDDSNQTFRVAYIGQQNFAGRVPDIFPESLDGAISPDYFVFTNIKFELSLDERVSSYKQQQNFQQLFGTSEVDTLGNPKLTLILDSSSLQAHAIQSVKNPFLTDLAQAFRIQVTEVPMSVSSGGKMLMGKHEHIYLRSNLSTNIWYKEGKKTNIISAIPLDRDTDKYQEYRPCGSETRIFDIKDSLNSIQHMQIAITDDQENLVQFTQNYQMEIAIFFLPDNQQSINF